MNKDFRDTLLVIIFCTLATILSWYVFTRPVEGYYELGYEVDHCEVVQMHKENLDHIVDAMLQPQKREAMERIKADYIYAVTTILYNSFLCQYQLKYPTVTSLTK